MSLQFQNLQGGKPTVQVGLEFACAFNITRKQACSTPRVRVCLASKLGLQLASSVALLRGRPCVYSKVVNTYVQADHGTGWWSVNNECQYCTAP